MPSDMTTTTSPLCRVADPSCAIQGSSLSLITTVFSPSVDVAVDVASAVPVVEGRAGAVCTAPSTFPTSCMGMRLSMDPAACVSGHEWARPVARQ